MKGDSHGDQIRENTLVFGDLKEEILCEAASEHPFVRGSTLCSAKLKFRDKG